MRRLSLLLAPFLAGCGLADLELTTETTQMSVIAPGDGTTIARVCPGPAGLFACNAEVSFRVRMQGEEKDAVVHDTLLGAGTHEVVFDSDAAGEPVTFVRVSDGAAATAQLPEPFTLAVPADADPQRDGLRVQWTPSSLGDRMSWHADRHCGNTIESPEGEAIDDDGELRVRANLFRAGCTTALYVTRSRTGEVDPGFPDGSAIYGAQERVVAVDATDP